MKKAFEGKIFTIPNLLSLFRLLLIPLIVHMYVTADNTLWTAGLLLLSGLTDTLDGWIARRFDQVSELGKALDPVADKLTQIAVVICMAFKFRAIAVLCIVLCVKEVFVALTSLLAIHRSGRVLPADWHGKAATTLMYATMVLHLLWADIPAGVSAALVGLCIAMVGLSGVMYGIRNLHVLRAERK